MTHQKCSIFGCSDDHYARGFCNRHYMRVRRTGTSDNPKRLTLEERFWSHVTVSGVDECWPWNAGCFEKGYGAFAVSHEETVRSHRFAYELANGPLAPDSVVRHRCDNPPCCNPSHLLAGTQQDNVDDRNDRQLQARGERVGSAKISEGLVRAIRLDDREQRAIAAEHNICKSTVGYIKRGETWKETA